MDTGNNAIVVKGLKKSFKNLEVLKGVDLNVERGTMLALLGPNGAGKTTTIRILSTLLKPDGGTALVNGFDVINDPNEVRSTIGLTGQYAAVDEYLTGRENLVMMGKLYHLSHANAVKRAEELLEQFDLTEAADRAAKGYSGGMKRRLDLGLSLVATPPILFLDEPTTGLDPRSRLAMWDVIEQLKKNGATILLTTQYLEEADKLADRIAVVDQGRIIAEGTASELKAKVGKDRLELVIADKNAFQTAVNQVKLNEGFESNEHDRIISFATDGVGSVKLVLDQMEKAGVKIEALSLHKPTLDDVFLKLTGHKTEAEKAEEKAK
jgi:ABC-2 type transport system ATP-binding protein